MSTKAVKRTSAIYTFSSSMVNQIKEITYFCRISSCVIKVIGHKDKDNFFLFLTKILIYILWVFFF